MGDAEANPEDLVGGEEWGTFPEKNDFWTISTIKDEKSAAKFHYIKTVSGEVVAQSIAFRVESIYWLEAVSYTHLTLPTNREV